MKAFFWLLIITAFSDKNIYGWDHIDQVSIATSENFSDMIRNSARLVVNFCDNQCAECQAFQPLYNKLAVFLAESFLFGIHAAQIDIGKEKTLAEKYSIDKTPTIKVFTRKDILEYQGSRNFDSLLNFLESAYHPDGHEITQLNLLDDVKKCKICALLLTDSDNREQIDNFITAIKKFPKIRFYYGSKQNLGDVPEVISKNNIILYRSFNDGNKNLNSDEIINQDQLEEFLETFQNPSVLEFDEQAFEKIFENEEKTVFLFTDDFQSEKVTLFEAIAQIKVGTLFSHVNINDPLGQKVSNFLGINPDENNVVLAVKFENGLVIKHRLDEWGKQELSRFVDDFKMERLPVFYKSQTVEMALTDTVRIIVGHQLDEEVFKSNKAVLLLITAPYCSISKKVENIFEELAKKVQIIDDLLIIKMDGTQNEHVLLPIRSFPLIKLLKKEEKFNPIEFFGERSVDSLIEFLEKELNIKINDFPNMKSTSEPSTNEL